MKMHQKYLPDRGGFGYSEEDLMCIEENGNNELRLT